MAMVPARRIVTRADWCGLIVTSRLRSRALALCATFSLFPPTFLSPSLLFSAARPLLLLLLSFSFSSFVCSPVFFILFSFLRFFFYFFFIFFFFFFSSF